MTVGNLPRWTRRAAALLLLLMLGGIVYAALVAPVLAQFSHYRREIAQSSLLLQRLTEVSARKAALEEEAEELVSEADDYSLYLEGENATVAGAALQARIRDIIEGYGGSVRSLQLLEPTVEDRFRRIGVRITAELDQSELADVLYDIETEPPFLFVDSLDVRRGRRGLRTQSDPEDRDLDVSFEISGMLWSAEQ